MNWITKIIKAGEKIKTAIHKRATKEDIANSDWASCCKGQILKNKGMGFYLTGRYAKGII